VSIDLETIAHHEAGHAVMAFRAGVTIDSASIVPDATSHGRVHHRNPIRGIDLDTDNSDRAYRCAVKLMRVCLAGPIAQSRFIGSYSDYGSGADYELAVGVAVNLIGTREAAKCLIESHLRQADMIIKRDWPLVTALARELLERTEMSGAEVQAFCASMVGGRG